MLKTGQIVKTPNDGATVLIREMKPRGLGDALGIGPNTEFLICAALAPNKGIAHGDYMAVIPGRTTFYLLPKALAEDWAPLSTPPRQTQEEILLSAGADRPGPRPDGCDCANPPTYPGAPGGWGVSVACPVHGDGEDEDEEPVADVDRVLEHP